jgi:DNA-binding NarL/FixJ family response regulator
VSPLRVVLAEDTVLLRQGVASLLREAGVEVVAETGDATELLLMVARHAPDAAIVDMRMPPGFSDEGLQAAAEIRSRYPSTAVLVFSGYLDETFLDQLVRESPSGLGYLLKDRVGELDELLDALRRVIAGECVVDREIVAQLMARRRAGDPLRTLTPREREVLELMAEGYSNPAICERLFISPKTLERHIGNVFAKLGLDVSGELNRRVAAVIAWLRRS